MKVAKVQIPKFDFNVWCERCCIRIAPNEEKTVIDGKIYHPQCSSKPVTAAPKQKR